MQRLSGMCVLLLLLRLLGGAGHPVWAAAMKVLALGPVTPAGLSSDEVWEAVGVDAQGRVYIASGAASWAPAPGDVGFYRYSPATDVLEYLSSAKTVLSAVGNLDPGERVAKVHTDWVPYQGKLYFATSDFHGTEDPATIRGAHLFQFDPQTGAFDDLARFAPNGVIAPNAGIQGCDIDQGTGTFVGMAYPSGQLIRFNLATHALSITAAPIAFQQVTRKVLATAGMGYFTYLASYTDQRGPLWAIATGTGAYHNTNQLTAFGIVHGRIHSFDGTKAWLLDELGGLTQFTVATETLTNLGSIITPADLSGNTYTMAMSNDGQRLFSFLTTNSTLYSYELATGVRTQAATFNGGAVWPNSPTAMTVDHAGNLYIADYDGGHLNGVRLVQLSGVPGSPPGLSGPQTYYVDATAPAGNGCAGAVSATTPVNTITTGISCLAAGDTLSIASGLYDEHLPDTIPSGTSASAQTTVKAATPGEVLVRPTSLPSGTPIVAVGTTQAAGRSFLTMQGLTIDGSLLPAGTRVIGLQVGSTSTGGARTGSHDILLDQIRVVDLPNNNAACGQSQPSIGIQVGQADSKVTLQQVTISNIGRGAIADPGTCAPDTMAYGVGIAFGGSDSLLTGLDITQTQAHALTFRGLSAGGANIVRNSYVHSTGAGILLACGGQSSVQVTNQLYNTIIASSGTFGQAPQAHSLVLGGACGGQTSTTTLVANSTIWNGKGSCVYVSGTSDGQASTNNTLRNLLCYANETNQVTVGSGATGTTIDHNLTTQDPLFVHTPPQQPTDFQVQVSPTKSPAIDTGIAVATATTSDYGGTLRPQPVGGVWDIGAWEAGPPPPVGGLVGHWPFDEGSSTTANDTTGVRPLTFPASTLTWTTGHVGPFALGCDGVNGAQHPTPFTLAQHTVMFWWWAQAAPGTTGRQVVANGASGTVASPVLVWSFSWGHWTATNRQAWTLYDGANTWTVLQYPTTLTPQTWYHLAATYDGTTYRAYLNGQPSLSKVGPGPATPQGAFMVCSGGSGLAESGQVDDLKVWNRALSDTEIAQQYSGQGGHRRQHRVVAQ
jgi:hypothetical protein